MAYGLYIANSSGVRVIDQSNTIMNEEVYNATSVSLTAGSSTNITIQDVQDDSLVAYDIAGAAPSNLTATTSTDTLTLNNTGAGTLFIDVTVYRFQ